MDKFVPPTKMKEGSGKRTVGLSIPRSKEEHTVKPTCFDDIGDTSPPAAKVLKTSILKQKSGNEGDSTITRLPNKTIKAICCYFDGSSEKRFSLDAMLDDNIKELLQKCKFAYVALQCILPEALVMVKEGWILPMDATIRELAQKDIFRFLNTETMNDSVPIYELTL